MVSLRMNGGSASKDSGGEVLFGEFGQRENLVVGIVLSPRCRDKLVIVRAVNDCYTDGIHTFDGFVDAQDVNVLFVAVSGHRVFQVTIVKRIGVVPGWMFRTEWTVDDDGQGLPDLGTAV